MALELWEGVSETFWSRHFWLPNNVTWDVFEDSTIYLAKPRDLWVPFPLAVGLFILRLIWERLVATPIGRAHKLSEKPPRKPIHNDVLEEAFNKNKKRLPDHKVLQGYSKQTDWTVRQIERWWRLRRLVNKPSEMQRFRETSWRFLFYLGAFWYGFFMLIKKPWFWDTKHCWYGWPKQEVTPELYWYYMVELGFYWSLIISVLIDNKRKDFAEMIVHHIATIALMMFSWSINMVRIGTLVLCVHDAVDYWMEGAKMANYMKYGKLCDALFVIFTIVWFFTRILIFPLRILRTSYFESSDIIGYYPAHSLLILLLLILQVLHFFWFYLILRMVYLYVIKGQVINTFSIGRSHEALQRLLQLVRIRATVSY